MSGEPELFPVAPAPARLPPWWEGPLLGLDFETTSADPMSARPVTVAMLFSPSPGAFEIVLELLIDPGEPIPAEATAVHGVTDAMAAGGCSVADAIRQVLDVLALVLPSVPLVIFNAPFDWTLLHCEARRLGLEAPPARLIIDPLVLDKAFDKYRPGKRQLAVTAALFGVAEEGAHDAGVDVRMAVNLARAIAMKHWRGHAVPPSAVVLQEAQARWYAEARASFIRYRARKGQSTNIPGGWPLQQGGGAVIT